MTLNAPLPYFIYFDFLFSPRDQNGLTHSVAQSLPSLLRFCQKNLMDRWFHLIPFSLLNKIYSKKNKIKTKTKKKRPKTINILYFIALHFDRYCSIRLLTKKNDILIISMTSVSNNKILAPVNIVACFSGWLCFIISTRYH